VAKTYVANVNDQFLLVVKTLKDKF